MTTERIDVLAVILRAADLEYVCEHYELAEDLKQAFDAVSELVDAAKDVSAQYAKHYGNATGLHVSLAFGRGDRLDAALARVGGA